MTDLYRGSTFDMCLVDEADDGTIEGGEVRLTLPTGKRTDFYRVTYWLDERTTRGERWLLEGDAGVYLDEAENRQHAIDKARDHLYGHWLRECAEA